MHFSFHLVKVIMQWTNSIFGELLGLSLWPRTSRYPLPGSATERRCLFEINFTGMEELSAGPTQYEETVLYILVQCHRPVDWCQKPTVACRMDPAIS